jgi:polysaccharide deacetylase 2 family uncharacterized protein YibQ
MSKPRIIIRILFILVIFQSILIVWLSYKVIKRPPARIKGRIAIVIDDWGYNPDNVCFFDRITYPLTLAILPNLPFSRTVAYLGHLKAKEIILHLPLEPQKKKGLRLEQYTITTQMSKNTVREILDKSIESLACKIKGISNHMGSKATRDSNVMAVIFEQMQRRNLYFLDSRVAKNSICQDLACHMRVKFAKRDIFLDNKDNRGYIKRQIRRLKMCAKRQGSAIGIGHDKKITLEVLAEVMPQIEKEGYKFVFVSQLVK